MGESLLLILEFNIVRLTFRQKLNMGSQHQINEYNSRTSVSNLFSFNLKTIHHLNLKLLVFRTHTTSFNI